MGDYWRAFALFPPLYLALFAIRGLCILLFNPLFTLLGSQALPLRAAAFATWGGLRCIACGAGLGCGREAEQEWGES